MSAPIGNQFWKLRSKHGRDKLFATPGLLWEAACEYFEWAQANPLIEVDFRGKDAEEVHLPKMRPFTIHGLCLYLDCSTVWWRNFKASLKHPKTETFADGETTEIKAENKDFIAVTTRIDEIIYNQKFEGAAAGFLNPNIIARDLGLKDHTEGTNTIILPELTPEQRKAFKDEFDREH